MRGDFKRFPADKPKIVLATSDLFASTLGISGELKEGGVLIFPSNRYQNEIRRAQNRAETAGGGRCLGEEIRADRRIQEEHITIDLLKGGSRQFPYFKYPSKDFDPGVPSKEVRIYFR